MFQRVCIGAFFLCLSLLAAACGDDDQPAAPEVTRSLSDYLPLESGTWFDYRVALSDSAMTSAAQGDSVRVTVTEGPRYGGQETVRSGLSRYEYEDAAFVSGSYRLYADGGGILDPPIVLGKDDWSQGETITTSFDLAGVTATVHSTFEAVESVEVPAGTYPDCMKVVVETSVLDQEIVGAVWFARGVGVVREIEPAGRVRELIGSGEASDPPPSILSISPSIGDLPGGDAVILTGAGLVEAPFGSIYQVEFGGSIPSFLRFRNSTEVELSTPAHAAGQVSVGFWNPDNQWGWAHDQFEYRAIWTATAPTGAPTGRSRHATVWTGTELLVWGGDVGNSIATGDGARFDPVSNTWMPISTSGAPTPRHNCAFVWTGAEMIVWGGDGSGPSFTLFNDGAIYNPGTDTWRPMSTEGAPQARRFSTAVWTGTEMIVWGGEGFTIIGTGGAYDPVGDSWRPVSDLGAPEARRFHTAVYTGTRMIIWGGENFNASSLSSGGLYDPGADSWSETTLGGAPDPRTGHEAAWTGTVMIVFGGLRDYSGSGRLNSGGKYDPVMGSWASTSTEGAPRFEQYGGNAPSVWSGTHLYTWALDQASPDGAGAIYDPVADAWSPIRNTAAAPGARLGHSLVWTGSRLVVWGGLRQGAFPDGAGGIYDPVAGN